MEQNEVILGVDTHLDAHVGAVISDTGKLLGTRSVSTDAAGYLNLLTWANSFGHLRRGGVEGTGTYGAGLARVLRDHEIEVLGALTVRHADPEASPIRPMLKTLRVQSSLEAQQLFQRNSLAPPRRCVPSLLPDAAQSRRRRRLSTSYGLCSSAHRRKFASVF